MLLKDGTNGKLHKQMLSDVTVAAAPCFCNPASCNTVPRTRCNPPCNSHQCVYVQNHMEPLYILEDALYMARYAGIGIGCEQLMTNAASSHAIHPSRVASTLTHTPSPYVSSRSLCTHHAPYMCMHSCTRVARVSAIVGARRGSKRRCTKARLRTVDPPRVQ
jgi:hypothetical protein